MAEAKNLKTIVYLFLLIFLKEGYLLIRNILGLVFHPYLTLRRIKVENDRSALVLLYASIVSPFLVALIISFSYLFLRIFLGLSLFLTNLIILLDVFLFLIFLIVGSWFAYWLRQTIKS